MSSKEFDDVIKPAEIDKENKKKEQKLETFKSESEIKEEKEKEQQTEWQTYFQNLNNEYAKTVKEVSQKGLYQLPINEDGTTKNTLFSRKRLNVKELRMIAAKQKEYNELPKDENSLFEAEQLASLYLEYAQMLLINNSTDKPITKEQFESQDWGHIRAVIDDCILKSLVGTTG